MEGFETKVRKTVEEYNMLTPGDRVIAAVSGGADSVCLLALLDEIRRGLGIRLRAVHVHHGLRDWEADRDAEFVRSLCSGLDVPCHIIKVDVRGLAKDKGMSEEEAGRYLRYEAFEREAEAWETEEVALAGAMVRVAVAHHRADQAETILYNIFRGSGLAGLRGIPYVRGRVIRPLLDVERKEILGWLSQKGLSYVEDSTNYGDHYTRNRIRGRVLPLIENEVNRGVSGNILRLGRLAGQADEYLRNQAGLWMNEFVKMDGKGCNSAGFLEDERNTAQMGKDMDNKAGGSGNGEYVIPSKEYLAQPEIIRSYIVMELLKLLSGQAKDLGECHVQQVLELAGKPAGKEVNLPYGMIARKEYGGIRLGFQGRQKDCCEAALPKVEIRVFSYEKGMEFPKKMYTKWFDCDKIEGTPVVRTRRTGDYITLAEGKTKTIKRFMIDEKIPRQMRDGIPLLADGSHVMWIIGRRISQFYKIGPDTERIFEVRVMTREEE